MDERVREFYEAVSSDGALQDEFAAVMGDLALEGVSEEEARHATADAVVALAADHGYGLAVEDLLAADADVAEGALSEGELAAVAGGGKCACVIIGAAKGCGCFIYGGKSMGGMSPGGEGGLPFVNPDACYVLGV